MDELLVATIEVNKVFWKIGEIAFEWKHTTWGEKLLSCCILGVPCLNFNHNIIMKDFHNLFAYHGRSKLK
jgi:hypothetical protein